MNPKPSSSQIQSRAKARRRHLVTLVLRKVISLIVAGLLLGWGYQWAAVRLYQTEHMAGFWLGTVHGGLMPAALPSLLIGKNVPIFANNNTGRTYKLGYITGINLCGLIFFGLAFRKPKVPVA